MKNRNNTNTVTSQVISHTRPSSTTVGATSTNCNDSSAVETRHRKRAPTRGPDAVERRHRKIFLQLGLVILSFAVGYIPSTWYLMWTSSTSDKDLHFDYWFGICSYLCLRLSECLNPVMYNLGSGKLRRETWKVLKGLRRKK